MPATAWNTRLDEATTDQAVIAVCDRFVTSCTFQELGQIPATCQPHEVVEAGDVSPYALKLVARLGDRDAAAAPTLHRMSAFFTKAAQRLVQIADAKPKHAPDPQEPPLVSYPYQ